MLNSTKRMELLRQRALEAKARANTLVQATRNFGNRSCGRSDKAHPQDARYHIDTSIAFGVPDLCYQLWQCLVCGHFIERSYAGSFRKVWSPAKAKARFGEEFI